MTSQEFYTVEGSKVQVFLVNEGESPIHLLEVINLTAKSNECLSKVEGEIEYFVQQEDNFGRHVGSSKKTDIKLEIHENNFVSIMTIKNVLFKTFEHSYGIDDLACVVKTKFIADNIIPWKKH